jgi:hypothetical protein
MNRLQLMMVCVFVVALGAGVVVGMGVSRPAVVKPAEHRGGGWIEEQLGLTSEQREQMKAIWSEARDMGQKHGEMRDQFRKERDAAVMGLFTPEQKDQYQKIQDDFRAQMGKLDKEREAAFNAAKEKTKAILNETQRAKYEELMKRGPGPRGPGRGPGGPGGQGGPGGPGGQGGPDGHDGHGPRGDWRNGPQGMRGGNESQPGEMKGAPR